MSRKILAVDDDALLRRSLAFNLERSGFTVQTAASAEDALEATRQFQPDLIILDIGLPGMDGLDALRLLRDQMGLPVILLTARRRELDQVLGLELGADDYVTKPFSSRELLAMIKAILRRGQPSPGGVTSFRFGNVEIDFDKYEARKSGRPVPLTALEFALMRFLIEKRGRVVHRNDVLDEVWGKDVYVDPRTVDKHISLLRRKFEDDPQEPAHILGVRGIGYKFTD